MHKTTKPFAVEIRRKPKMQADFFSKNSTDEKPVPEATRRLERPARIGSRAAPGSAFRAKR